MREIGTLPSTSDGERLANYLRSLGIRSRVDAHETGASIWVYDEDQRERAGQVLAEFLANPQDPRYDNAAREARRLEREAESQERRYRKNVVDLRSRWASAGARRRPVTFSLLLISVAVAVASGFGEHGLADAWVRNLLIVPLKVVGDQAFSEGLEPTLTTQPWRLVTPIFIHFGLMHLLFNLFAVTDLGTQVEIRRGHWRMLALVLLIAVSSNLAQYFYSGPGFGGLSGVAYGLFGYIWMKSRFAPESGFFLHQSTVLVMMVWFFFCIAGEFRDASTVHVANMAHAAGLGVGIIIGLVPVVWRELRG